VGNKVKKRARRKRYDLFYTGSGKDAKSGAGKKWKKAGRLRQRESSGRSQVGMGKQDVCVI